MTDSVIAILSILECKVCLPIAPGVLVIDEVKVGNYYLWMLCVLLNSQNVAPGWSQVIMEFSTPEVYWARHVAR